MSKDKVIHKAMLLNPIGEKKNVDEIKWPHINFKGFWLNISYASSGKAEGNMTNLLRKKNF